MYIDAYEIWKKLLDVWGDDFTVNWWNEYCDKHNYPDDKIYPFDEVTINDFMQDMTPYEILMYGKDIEPCATYFQWGVYFETFNGYDLEDRIDLEELFKDGDVWSKCESFYSSYCSRIAEFCGISNEDSIEYDFDEFIRDEYVVVEVPDETDEIIEDWKEYKKLLNEE